MPFTLTMPKLSPTMTSGTIAKWHKKVGDQVSPGDLLLEINTDKATVEHEALDGGWLRQIIAAEGAEVAVNQPLAVLTESQDESIEGYTPVAVGGAEPSAATAALPKTEPAAKEAPAQTAQPKAEKSQPSVKPTQPPITTAAAHTERVAASPLARKLAKEKGIELEGIQGTGPGQRVMSRDLANVPQSPVLKSKHESRSIPSGSSEAVRLSPMRQVIAKRLQEAKSTIPHFYVHVTVNAEPLIAVRAQLDSEDIKLTYNDFVVRACALALQAFPGVNAGFDPANNVMLSFKTVDICVAVSVPDGLITPIIRYADTKTLSEIGSEVRALAKLAREGKLKAEQYQGGSFTISNLGMYGVDDFIAVINPPQAAILAVGGIRDVPVVKHGAVVPGKEMGIVLSADHRVVDGSLAAQFIRKVQHYLENPALLCL